MVSNPRILRTIACGLLALTAAVHAEQPPDPESAAAASLWRSFNEAYAKYSLRPLAADVLDEKARAALIRTAGPRFRSWKPDQQPTFPALLDAVAAKDGSVSQFSRVEQTLTAMLPEIDTYGSYKSAADVAQWIEAMRRNPGSIHMTLDQAEDGRILCYPLPDGPAEKAGINAGAMLLAVDQRPVEGKSLSAIRLAFVGPAHTPIVLRLKQPQGKIEELSVTRTDQASPNVAVTKTPLGLSVRLRKFDETTARTVKSELEAHPKPGRLSLDLRGNPGGLRDEALKIASLFFAEGTPLGKFTTQAGEQVANDGNGLFVEPTSIQILQDGRTASAAEYLIASLKEGLPGKVTLFGARTYGKSHSTVHVKLEGGGELAVTEALLSTAAGRSWDKTGIEPDKPQR